MEIERKYLIDRLPTNLDCFPSRHIQQGYLCTSPVIRIRKDGEHFFLTYKSSGLLAREEYNLPLTKEAYRHLLPKADGILIEKNRFCIPLAGGLTIELDVFEGKLAPLVLAEVEFPDKESALSFSPPPWFGKDVTFSGEYQNSRLIRRFS
ncbi:MAG TPA: CYTH domain-containing protein [Candidatus Bariatricus faecipullorum]|nr:CYTH domain-containing protein [Candidatus Bariatricus faecipullorum]